MHQQTQAGLLQKHCYSSVIPEGKLIETVHISSAKSVGVLFCIICVLYFYVLCIHVKASFMPT